MALETRRKALADCSPAVVSLLRGLGRDWVEIGAGEGAWARALRAEGLRVVAYDIAPRGAGVVQGDHVDAAAPGGNLLIVWPPDGPTVQAWIEAAPWGRVVIVGSFTRFDTGKALSAYAELQRLSLPPGRKGGSELAVFAPA